MNSATTEVLPVPPTGEGLAVVVPLHLTARFEEADQQIRAAYGVAPGPETLVRLWLACGNAAQVRREFEEAVLGITKPGFEFENDGDGDDETHT